MVQQPGNTREANQDKSQQGRFEGLTNLRLHLVDLLDRSNSEVIEEEEEAFGTDGCWIGLVFPGQIMSDIRFSRSRQQEIQDTWHLM